MMLISEPNNILPFTSHDSTLEAEVPNYGFTDSAYWVRLRVDNETRRVEEWLLEVGYANMQYVGFDALSIEDIVMK